MRFDITNARGRYYSRTKEGERRARNVPALSLERVTEARVREVRDGVE